MLRDRDLIAGRIDARFSGPSLNPLSDVIDYDPFFPAVGPADMAAFREYLHSELKFDKPDQFVISGGLCNEWDWRHAQPGADGNENGPVRVTNLIPALAHTMAMNSRLHLLVDHWYYDLATPTHALKYNLDQLRLTPEARARIRINMYHRGPHDLSARAVGTAVPGECGQLYPRDRSTVCQ